MPSQKQIARELGISVATVSNALTGKGRVSESVSKLVADRAAQLGYYPSAAGRALKTGRSGILGFVMPDITQPLFPKLAQGVEAAADRCGFGVLITDSRGTEFGQNQAITQLIQRGVDGIVVVPQRGTEPDVSSVPVAIVNTPSDPANTVSANHHQGGVLAAQTLRGLGHRKILLLGGDPQSEVQKDRIAGMIDGLSDSAEFETCWAVDGLPDLTVKHNAGFTAVIAVSDLLAVRVLTEAYQAGIRCPGDISIIGFDDLPASTAVRPMLTTIAPDIPEIAKRTVAYLHAAISGQSSLPGPSAIDMTLVHRQSTSPVPPAQVS